VQHVDWDDRALEDLRELPPDVARFLLDLGESSLHIGKDMHEMDPDEGSGLSRNKTPLYWRRGLTRRERSRLTELERRPSAEELDDSQHANPWDYILLYRERSMREVIRRRGRGLVVLRVVHITEVAYHLRGRLPP
jgi:hypothetical protein